MLQLKKKRLEKGWTQAYIAEKLWVAKNTISQYEKGLREPRLALLKRMAQLLECKVDELI